MLHLEPSTPGCNPLQARSGLDGRCPDVWAFEALAALPDAFDLHGTSSGILLRQMFSGIRLPRQNMRVADLLHGLAFGASLDKLVLDPCVAFALLDKAGAMLARSDACLVRSVHQPFPLQSPPRALVDRWRKECDVARKSQTRDVPTSSADDAWMAIALALPDKRAKYVNADQDAPIGSRAQKRFPIDPLHVVRGLEVSKFLKDQRYFSDCLARADEFDNKLDVGASTRDVSDDVSRTSRQKGFALADIMGMLLQRREMQANRLCGRVKSMNLFTDASPVTGEELQGMVLEQVFNSEPLEVVRDVLPGSTLVYGQYGAISKTVALYYSLWLVAGPWFCDMAWLVALVRGIVTDGGNEARTVELPNIVKAFNAWMSGAPLLACRGLVDFNRRLFHRALRVAGWSHFWGGLLKAMANSLPEWPRIIEQARACIKFPRVKAGRKH